MVTRNIRLGHDRRWSRRQLLGASMVLSAIGLVGCSSGQTGLNVGAELLAWPAKNQWPQRLTNARSEVQEAYRYAVVNRDVLQYMPCFCGCGADGHRSNYDCYVRESRPDGSVLLDPMSFG